MQIEQPATARPSGRPDATLKRRHAWCSFGALLPIEKGV
jgi:hypothetical protein